MALTSPLNMPNNTQSPEHYGLKVHHVGYRMEELRYPYKWRDYDIPYERVRARFPQRRAAEANWLAESYNPHEDFPYTEVEVRSRFHRRLALSVNPVPYLESCRFNPNHVDDLEHKKRIADTMLDAYFNTGEGRGLNVESINGRYFNQSKIENIIDAANHTERIAIKNENDYFRDFRHEMKPQNKTFVKGMEYDPMYGRIEIDIETVNYTYSDYPFEANPADPEAIIKTVRANLRSKLTIIVKSRAQPIRNIPENEQRAIETLREMITEAEFRKYIKDGFILVRGLSGRVYQIFRNHPHTKVWEKGKLVEEVCVRIDYKASVPPTDNVIAFRTAILCSEDEFRKLGNVYNMREAA